MAEFTDRQYEVLGLINIIFSTLSFVGSSFIIFMFWRCHQLRNFAFSLVVWISVSDCLYSLASFIPDPPSGSFACYFQALFISFFELSSVFWTVCIAVTLHLTLLKENSDFALNTAKYSKRFHLFCWITPGVLTILPLFTESYGDSGGWCWITTDDNPRAGTAWRFIQFYIPLWICFIYNLTIYFKVTRSVRKMIENVQSAAAVAVAPPLARDPSLPRAAQVHNEPGIAPSLFRGHSTVSEADFEDDAEPPEHSGPAAVPMETHDAVDYSSAPNTTVSAQAAERSTQMLDRIKYYPLVLFYCYFFASISRIQQIFGEPAFGLVVLHTIGAASQGIANAFVYGLTPSVRGAFRELCEGWARQPRYRWFGCCFALVGVEGAGRSFSFSDEKPAAETEHANLRPEQLDSELENPALR